MLVPLIQQFLLAFKDIASAQAKPTQQTNDKVHMLLDYMSTYPNAKLRFHASNMVLQIDSDAAYLVLPGAKSRIPGYYNLGSKTPPTNTTNHSINGPIHVKCKAQQHVVSSASEAKTAALFHNAKNAIELQRTLLGHPQPTTPLKTGNSTALGFVKNLVNQKRSNSWDMRFQWL